MSNTLSEILKKYDNRNFKCIEYRTFTTVDGKATDTLIGMAAYKNKMLISLDGDSYHLNDQIAKHELFQDDWLIVWQ